MRRHAFLRIPSGPRSRRFGWWTFATAAAATLLGISAHAAEPTARFDWSMAARFAVPEPGGPDAPYEAYVAGALHPQTWPVAFDACASSAGLVEYRWRIDGVLAATESACDGFSWPFPSEGSYTVSLTVVDGDGAEATAARTVVVQDLLIFGLGDSYGSGEGAPDEPVPPEAIELANAKQIAVDSASAARDAAVAAYLDALAEYQVTDATLDAVVAALVRYQNAKAAVAANCPFPVVACGQATAELTAATAALLVELAQAGLDALDIDQPATILDAIADLRTLATAALHAAQTTRDAAEVALAAAQAELASARAAVQARWQSRSCHRSSRAAQAQAARLLEERDPHTSVTFVHLACSGATIWEGIVGPYAGIEEASPPHAPQLEGVAELALVDPVLPELGLHRPVDAILLSIGGNDVNFADIITMCITHADCPDAPAIDAVALAARSAYCSTTPLWARSECFDSLAPPDLEAGMDGEALFRQGDPSKPHPNGLEQLPAGYAEIREQLAAAGLGDAPVHLTQYPDITRDESGDICGWQPLDDLATRQANLLGIDPDEMAWAAAEVAVPLSDAMAMSAGGLGWSFVEGAAARFRTHGYCSQQHWVVRLQESFAIQGQPWGVVHPNASGHAAWAEEIAAAVPEPGAGTGAAAALAALAAFARRRGQRGGRSCRSDCERRAATQVAAFRPPARPARPRAVA